MQAEILFCLQRQWRWVSAVWLLTWLTFYTWLKPVWSEWAGPWAVTALLPLFYGLVVLWRGLPENHRFDEQELLPTLGWGSQLTLLRGLAIGLLAGFLWIPYPPGGLAWLPALLYTVADLADYLDGYLARLTRHVTLLGGRLDMEFDGLGVLVVSLLAVRYGQLPWWYLVLGVVRYLFIFGLWWRKRKKLPIYEMPASVHRRVFAGFHMSFLSVVLWPVIPASGAMIAGVMFGTATAVSFLRDWLVMAGWLDPDSAVYRRTQQQIFRLMTRHLPPILRIVTIICLPMMLASLPRGHPAGSFLIWVGWIAGTAVFLGCMGRVFALLLIFPVWLHVVTYGITLLNGILLVCAIYLMLLGTGRFSWWQPEEQYIARRPGENV